MTRNSTLYDDSAPESPGPDVSAPEAAGRLLPAWVGGRSLVLVGLPGAGKSAIGRRLALRLGLGFRDADSEIERAAGCSVSELFARHGEPAFREGERRVIRRLLAGPPVVLATGGGAFMDGETRAAVRADAVSIWLRCRLATDLQMADDRAHLDLFRVAADLQERRGGGLSWRHRHRATDGHRRHRARGRRRDPDRGPSVYAGGQSADDRSRHGAEQRVPASVADRRSCRRPCPSGSADRSGRDDGPRDGAASALGLRWNDAKLDPLVVAGPMPATE